MIRLSLALTFGLLVAAFVAWRLGGALGAGVVAGYLLGGGIGGLGVLWQRHVLQTRPERAMHAVALSFGAKLFVLGLGALAFRYLDGPAQRIDWRSFLVAFAAAVALVVPVGAADAARALTMRPRSARLARSGASSLAPNTPRP